MCPGEGLRVWQAWGGTSPTTECLKLRRPRMHPSFPGGKTCCFRWKGVGSPKVLKDRTLGGSPTSLLLECLLGQHQCSV